MGIRENRNSSRHQRKGKFDVEFAIRQEEKEFLQQHQQQMTQAAECTGHPRQLKIATPVAQIVSAHLEYVPEPDIIETMFGALSYQELVVKLKELVGFTHEDRVYEIANMFSTGFSKEAYEALALIESEKKEMFAFNPAIVEHNGSGFQFTQENIMSKEEVQVEVTRSVNTEAPQSFVQQKQSVGEISEVCQDIFNKYFKKVVSLNETMYRYGQLNILERNFGFIL